MPRMLESLCANCNSIKSGAKPCSFSCVLAMALKPCGTMRFGPQPNRFSACPSVASEIGLPATNPGSSKPLGLPPVIACKSVSNVTTCRDSGTRCSPGVLRRIFMRSPGMRHSGPAGGTNPCDPPAPASTLPPRSNSPYRALRSSPGRVNTGGRTFSAYSVDESPLYPSMARISSPISSGLVSVAYCSACTGASNPRRSAGRSPGTPAPRPIAHTGSAR